MPPPGSPLDLADIQGFVLRNHRYPRARFFVFEVEQPLAARAWLGSLSSSGQGPQITSAAVAPADRPAYCLSLGLTRPGLEALGVTGFDFRSFPSFLAGAASRAAACGDAGDSAPAHWIGGLGTGRDHIILSLYAFEQATLEQVSGQLREGSARDRGLRELLAFDAKALPGEKVHFGYRDGLTQPTITGAPDRPIADGQPPVPAWNFVLLDDPDRGYRLPEPRWLGLNGSFGVFRVLRQDVAGFERYLMSQRDVIDPELLAAKLMGRWRNGVPLSLSPDTQQAELLDSELNRFDYVKPPAGRELALLDVFDDSAGLRCPLGSHIRRVNPRSTPVSGGGGHLHRLLRRGLPYGPPYDPGQPDDGIERGLAGFFINASIENQYEFVVRKWMNEGGFAAGLASAAKDPIAGDNDANASRFEIRREGQPALRVSGFARFVQARGGAYCFLPSLSALQTIARL